MTEYPAKERLNTSKITGAWLETVARIMHPCLSPEIYCVPGNLEDA